jgi:hypothetical protein
MATAHPYYCGGTFGLSGATDRIVRMQSWGLNKKAAPKGGLKK